MLFTNDISILEHSDQTMRLDAEADLLEEESGTVKKSKKRCPSTYACDCGKVFKRKQSLDNHRNFVCGKMKQRYCSICRKFFWANQQLKHHQKICHPNSTV